MSSVIVAKAYVILAFKIVISGTGVENTLSLTYPHKKKSGGGWYQAIVVARVSDHLSQSTCLEMLHPKTDEHVNPSVEVHHIVGKLSTAENLLTEVQQNFLVINICNQGKDLCSLCKPRCTVTKTPELIQSRKIPNRGARSGMCFIEYLRHM